MKKILKGLMCAALGGVLAVGAAGCSKGPSEHRNPESDSLNLAIGPCEEKFNPMFYTSQNDGEIASMTQASLITADKDGNLAYGDNYPTATLDYLETYRDAGGTVLGYGDGVKSASELSSAATTEYEFLIKNGMQFSDGKPLTVVDIVFNLYVYLDPMYAGSNTIYSTKILGLQSYRQQKIGVDEFSTLDTTEYRQRAQTRISNLKRWSDGNGTLSEQGEKDLEEVKNLYKQELTSDWASIASGWKEGYRNYKFTETWEVFYYSEGLVEKRQELDPETNTYKDMVDPADGKFLTTFDPDPNGGTDRQALRTAMENAVTPAKVTEYATEHGVTEEEAKEELQKQVAITTVHNANTSKEEIKNILTYNATASTALDTFMRQEMSSKADDENPTATVPRISGITVKKGKGLENKKQYSDDHDILSITIKNVDPKAKWNFGIPIAPMHYYSSKEEADLAQADYAAGKYHNGTATHFGVKFKNQTFFDKELASDKKNGIPVGAGPYKACSYNHSGSSSLTSDDFFHNYRAYFERNEYFHTMGANIDDAKIKYVTYRTMTDDKIVSALKTGEIDYGEPTATAENQTAMRTGNLKQIRYLEGGYGYVGINPRFVEDLEVRQAIMMSFNTGLLYDYYGEDLVNLIDRPMSTTSWAYPDAKSISRVYPLSDAATIRAQVLKNRKWTYDAQAKKLKNKQTEKTIDLAFTIAGETTDHPAYEMFTHAQALLNEAGFNITVETDQKALTKLVTGELKVWAAAWSSSIDPDPYQIYSKNSNASSTKNWNKDGIYEDKNKFGREQAIADALNEKIIAGRATLNQEDRKKIYGVSAAGVTVGDGKDLEKKCTLDLIMELAVEFPTYQRYRLCVYNGAVIDDGTILKKASYNMGPIAELWKVNFKK